MEPKPGYVIRYDFLWKEDQDAGRYSGKDRPCAIVVVAKAADDGSKRVFLCPITHSPPGPDETAVKIPLKAARQLGLDDEQSWIKTDQVNRYQWPAERVPLGLSIDRKGEWLLGELPRAIAEKAFDQVREKGMSRTLKTVVRQDDVPLERSYKAKDDAQKDRLKRPEHTRRLDRNMDRERD